MRPRGIFGDVVSQLSIRWSQPLPILLVIMLGMSLNEVVDEAIGGRNAWMSGKDEMFWRAPWLSQRDGG